MLLGPPLSLHEVDDIGGVALEDLTPYIEASGFGSDSYPIEIGIAQADGSVHVAFNASGATAKDPELINRVTQSYNRRMGR